MRAKGNIIRFDNHVRQLDLGAVLRSGAAIRTLPSGRRASRPLRRRSARSSESN